MKRTLLAGFALVAASLNAPAKAADMPVKYVAPTVFTWTGCYVGATIGYKWGRSKHTSAGAINGGVVANPGHLAGQDIAPQFNLDGVIGGGEAGCNWQSGNWVYGIEVDGSWSTAEGQAHNFIYDNIFDPFLVSKTSERWLMTARGRIGYAADKWLWYVTAGAAWTGVDINSSSVGQGGVAQIYGIERHNKTGWVVGFGSEYALVGGWSVKSEWLYANFGKIHALDTSCAIAVCGAPFAGVLNRDVSLYEFVWRVGMNYRFDWATWGKGKAPVVAKY